MKLRRSMLPKSLADFGAFTFVLIMIPATYWFELFVVVPSMYPMWSFWHSVHFICGTFLMINITSNLVASIIVDTSIIGKVMSATMKTNWRFCAVCETLAPPRSWHCNTCKTCILKRDHHCLFTGCCIGHFNYRYFYMFVIYMFIATFYASYFNNFFIWTNSDFQTPMTILKMVFPLAMLVFGLDTSYNQCYLLIYLINLVGTLFTFALICIHTNLITRGTTAYEKNHKISEYNFGTKNNIKEVLGEKWHIAWLLPFIHSELPHDGIHWSDKNTLNLNSFKNR